MRAIYIAEDGTLFDNGFDCETYEFKTSLRDVNKIYVYDEDGDRFGDLFEDDAYNYSNMVIVETDNALKSLHKIADYCGWCLWKDIKDVGKWKFRERTYDEELDKVIDERFVKVV